MTPYTIRKPDVLITEDYQNACGDTCAAGWIAVQTGMDTEQASFDQADYDEAEWTEHLVHTVGLDPAEVTRLSIRNDNLSDSNEKRIENLRRFVENSPILHWDAA